MSDVVPIDGDLERARRRALLVRAFHVVFGSDEGRMVLGHLLERFPPDFPRFGQHTAWDPIRAAVLDGQGQVMAQIMDFLGQPAGDDATARPEDKVTNITT